MKNSKIGERIDEALALRGMRANALADATGLSNSLISRYRRDNHTPAQDRLTLLAEALNVADAWLLGYDVPMERDGQKIEMDRLKENIKEVLGEEVLLLVEHYLDLNEHGKDVASYCLEGFAKIERFTKGGDTDETA